MAGTGINPAGATRKPTSSAVTFAQVKAALEAADSPVGLNGYYFQNAYGLLFSATAAVPPGSATTDPAQVGVAGFTTTGAHAGRGLTLSAGKGQNQTGANANNAGGDVVIQAGDAGSGGGGAAANPGSIVHKAGSVPLITETFKPTLGGDYRWTLGSAVPYLVFEANAAGQLLDFQALQGFVFFDSPQTFFRDGGAANVVALTNASAGPSSFEIASTVTGYSFVYDTKATGTGGKLSLSGQPVTTGTGGDVEIGPGTGSAANGVLRFLNLATTTSAPSAGGAGALPATPAGYVSITINGTARKIPYY
jgi:hypothetical protein